MFFTSVLIVVGIWYAKANKIQRKRGWYMFWAMTLFTGIWTIAEFVANTRWIEYGFKTSGFFGAGPFMEWLVLSYRLYLGAVSCGRSFSNSSTIRWEYS